MATVNKAQLTQKMQKLRANKKMMAGGSVKVSQTAYGNKGSSGPLSAPIRLGTVTFQPAIPKPAKVRQKEYLKKLSVRKTLSAKGEECVPDAVEQRSPKTSAGYAFVVKQGPEEETAEWRYVTFNYGTTLDTALHPNMVFPSITGRHHEFWKRVVIDQAFDWDSGQIHPRTLRIVEIFLDVRDVTPNLFMDQETFEHSRKLAALSKLTDEEARLLECEQDYVFLKISQNKKKSHQDQNLADELRSELHHLGVN